MLAAGLGVVGRMSSESLLHPYLHRLKEVDLYIAQDLKEDALVILKQILAEVDQSHLPVEQQEEVKSWVDIYLQRFREDGRPNGDDTEERFTGFNESEKAAEPCQSFEYGLALMDGLFWREAIDEFRRAASEGYRTGECWELCGDCASFLEEWQEAIQYYSRVYKDINLTGELKQKILLKITRCSQAQKKAEVKLSPAYARAERKLDQKDKTVETNRPYSDPAEVVVASLNESSTGQLLGQTITSWRDKNGAGLVDEVRSYRVVNLLHVGMTSLIVELEDNETGKRLAGQTLTGKSSLSLSPEILAKWAYVLSITESRNLVTVLDLACSEENRFFIVRECLPMSLAGLLSGGEPLPIPLAVLFAHRILEGLGDLHLRMGADGQIRSVYHLDLRPSRVLFHADKPIIKIYNGGLWQELEKMSHNHKAIRQIPLPFLAYRAPEQFRPYLARKKPPVFTDIYQFGTLFYEMLTGIPAFRASSYEEYEIQHCDQYPTPPKVWRPEIPDLLNEIIMKCLECDPMKRWRSATQLSLSLEKPFQHYVNPPRDGFYTRLIESCHGV